MVESKHLVRHLSLLLLGYYISGAESRPGTNFASSAITSDNSGTRSSQLVGTIPDPSYSPTGKLGSSSTLSGNGGSGILTRTGSGTNSGSGGTSVLSSQSTGTGGGSGGIVGIASRTGPSGTQHAIITSGNEPSVLGRFGGSQPVYSPGQGGAIGSVASVPGASATAVAGPGGSAAGSFAGRPHDYSEYYDG